MNYLLYLAFGGSDYYNETLFSLLSYFRLHHPAENAVVVYTDNPAFFSERVPYPLTLVPLSAEKLAEWKGPKNFPYRIKTKVLQDATTRFTGNILYVDTDTVFTQNIGPLYQKLEEGAYLMDACEGSLKDNPGGIARKMKKLLARQTRFEHLSLPAPVLLDESFVVWNSGSAGFNTAYIGKKLEHSERLMDLLFDAYPLYTMEQIALSYYFAGNLEETRLYIHHYWYFKDFRKPLREFFHYHKEASFTQLAEKAQALNPYLMSAGKRAYKKMSFWRKLWHRITHGGRKWEVPPYRPS